jgi:hypothetical protein
LRGHKLPLAGVGVAMCLLRATTAWGQPKPRDPVGAEALFRQGLAALKANDWQTGCEKFRKSMVLDGSVSTQFKLAKCSEHDGKLATAWYEYETALKLNRDAQTSDRRKMELEAAIRAAIATLKPRVPMLSVKVAPRPDGLEVSRDGIPIDNSVLGESLPVDPGDHELLARAPGFHEVRQRVTVAEGRPVEIDLRLVAKPVSTIPQPLPPQVSATAFPAAKPSAEAQRQPISPSVRPPKATEVELDTGSKSFRWGQQETGLTLAGTGALALAAAGYCGIRTWMYISDMDDFKHSSDNTYDKGVFGPRDNAAKFQTLGFAFAGAGAALVGIGLDLYLTASPRKPTTAQVRSAKVEVQVVPFEVMAQGI